MSTTQTSLLALLLVISLLRLSACAPAESLPYTPKATAPLLASATVPVSATPGLVGTPVATTTPTPFVPALLPAESTLGDYLQAYQLPTAGLAPTFLEQKVRIPLVSNGEQAFFMTYYLEASDFPRPLQLLKYEKATSNWLTAEVREPEPATAQPGPPGEFVWRPDETYRLGDLMGVIESNEFYYIGMHSNPSAGWTLIITKELEFYDSLFGSVHQVFPDGMAVYNRGGPHFAPTYYALIELYDPATQASHLIFPQEPYQPLWRQRMGIVGQVYQELGEAWCRENNHHCDPERFNNRLEGEVAVNEETDSLAFTIVFTSEWLLDLPGETRVVYIFRDVHNPAQLTYREAGEDQLEQLFGDFLMADLLEAENLDLIFNQFDYSE